MKYLLRPLWKQVLSRSRTQAHHLAKGHTSLSLACSDDVMRDLTPAVQYPMPGFQLTRIRMVLKVQRGWPAQLKGTVSRSSCTRRWMGMSMVSG